MRFWMLTVLIEKPHAVPRDCSYELLAPLEVWPLSWYFFWIRLWPYDRLAQDIFNFGNETQTEKKQRHVIRPCQWFENNSRFFFKYRINDHVFFGEQKIRVRFWPGKKWKKSNFLDSTKSVIEVGWGKSAMSISLRVSLLSTSALNDLNGQEDRITLAIGFRGSCDWWGKAKCREERPLKLMFVLKKNRIFYWNAIPQKISLVDVR